MTQRLTQERLEAMRARLVTATPGPWSADLQPGDCTVWGPAGVHDVDTHHGPAPVWLMNLADGETQPIAFDLREAANAEFIACARTDVADLLAEVDALRAELAEAEQRGREAEQEAIYEMLDGWWKDSQALDAISANVHRMSPEDRSAWIAAQRDGRYHDMRCIEQACSPGTPPLGAAKDPG